jgi:hypothetical protein
LSWLTAAELDPDQLLVPMPLMLVASNSIGSVPTIILHLDLPPNLNDAIFLAFAPLSTFAGNLLLTGSLCNIIVAERAQASGVKATKPEMTRDRNCSTTSRYSTTLNENMLEMGCRHQQCLRHNEN